MGASGWGLHSIVLYVAQLSVNRLVRSCLWYYCTVNAHVVTCTRGSRGARGSRFAATG